MMSLSWYPYCMPLVFHLQGTFARYSPQNPHAIDQFHFDTNLMF